MYQWYLKVNLQKKCKLQSRSNVKLHEKAKMLWIYVDIFGKIPMISGVNFTQVSLVFLFPMISMLKLNFYCKIHSIMGKFFQESV